MRLLELSSVRAVRIVAFDFTRAFDCMPHHLLLRCLRESSIQNRDYFVNLINNYLCNRQQCVKLGETISSSKPVTSGVPQGSLLGPYLFSLYMSSYQPLNTNVKVVKYADYITLIVPVFHSESDDLLLFSSEIDHFMKWCSDHRMSVNCSKTNVLSINFSSSPLSNISDFQTANFVKILGLVFNDKLTWSNHFRYVISCVSKRLYVLRILKSLFSHDQLILVFNSIIRSMMDYSSSVFIYPGVGLNADFERLCKRAFRIIHGFKAAHCDRCAMFDLTERREKLALRLFYKAFNDPNHVLHELLPSQSHRSSRLILPEVKTTRRRNGFVISCALLHNGLSRHKL